MKLLSCLQSKANMEITLNMVYCTLRKVESQWYYSYRGMKQQLKTVVCRMENSNAL